jgi:transcriptional regulator with XRE-family HTH domain
MPALRRKPGSPKDQPKPRKWLLDKGFAGRIKQAMAEHNDGAGIDVPDLAERVGCTRALLGKYRNGDATTAEPLLLLKIAQVLKVRLEWIIVGELPMRNANPSEHMLKLAKAIDVIDDDEKKRAAIRAAIAVINSLTTQPVADTYKTSERPKIGGLINRPSLFNDDFPGPRKPQ